MSSIEPDFPPVVRVGRDPDAAGDGAPRASVSFGLGMASGDGGMARIDLNDILVRHPQASFLMRAAGSAMRDLGIDTGDLLLIDRAIRPAHGHVVIAVVGDEFVCRQLRRQGATLRLHAPRSTRPDIVAGEDGNLELWGVVTRVIKTLAA